MLYKKLKVKKDKLRRVSQQSARGALYNFLTYADVFVFDRARGAFRHFSDMSSSPRARAARFITFRRIPTFSCLSALGALDDDFDVLRRRIQTTYSDVVFRRSIPTYSDAGRLAFSGQHFSLVEYRQISDCYDVCASTRRARLGSWGRARVWAVGRGAK